MKSFIIEINDIDTLQKDYIKFSQKDLLKIYKIAGKKPVTPEIVKRITSIANQKGYNISETLEKLYWIAKQILIDEEGAESIACTRINKLNSNYDGNDNFNDSYNKIENNIEKRILNKRRQINIINNSPLILIQYENSLKELENLTNSIVLSGKTPVIWSKACGLISGNLSNHHVLFEDAIKSELNDPEKLLRFIIQKPQEHLDYILEDFHHYLGDKSIINPSVGELRSLLKELYRNLKQRDENVFVFVPASYELPDELDPFFTKSNKSFNKQNSYLKRFGHLLNDSDYIARTKPVIGAEDKIERIIQILGQMEANNPLLVGLPGVGKTAIVDGFAKALLDAKTIPKLANKKLYCLSLNSLIAGTRYRGDFEIRLEGLMDEVLRQKDNIIIFIDEIHSLLDAGSTENASGAGEILKPVLARGEFPCIGATTPDGVNIFSKDPALSRRFKKIIIKEPDKEETLRILTGISQKLEIHHNLKLTKDALIAAVELSIKNIPEENLPGKAVSLIDGAAAFCSMRGKKKVYAKDIEKEILRFRGELK